MSNEMEVVLLKDDVKPRKDSKASTSGGGTKNRNRGNNRDNRRSEYHNNSGSAGVTGSTYSRAAPVAPHEAGGHRGVYSMDSNRPQMLLGAPTFEIPVKEKTDESKKFTGRCRLFVANLPHNMTEHNLKKLFESYGEVADVFLGKGNTFAFVKMDTRANAEAARDALDFKNYSGRSLRVRLAGHPAALKVKNLSPMVTNELLEYAFSYFGDVERAVVIVDDRGRSVGEGIVEFARKSAAQLALKRCINECFMLTSLPKPVHVEPFEERDEGDGFAERHVNKNIPEFKHEREVGPHFAEIGSFEFDYAMRWKKLLEVEREKRDRLEMEIAQARQDLHDQMEYSRMEHQTKLLKDQLKAMEDRRDRMSTMRNDRASDERRREDERQRREREMIMRQQEDELLRRSQVQDFGGMQRQETELRMQANALQDILDRQEQPPMRSFPGNEMYGNQRPAFAGGDMMGQQGSPGLHHGGMGHMGLMNAQPAMDMPVFATGQGQAVGGSPMAYGGQGVGGGHQQQQHFGRSPFTGNGGPEGKRRRF